LLPSPWSVAAAFAEHNGILFSNAVVTLSEVLISFAACLLVGVPVGILTAKSRLFARSVYPVLAASQSVPILAAAPLLVVWFGIGLTPKIIVAFMIAFFPIAVGTAVGLRSVKRDSIMLARSMGLSGIQTFTKIEVPTALPSLIGGMKTATALCVVGSVVGEYVGASSGLGYLVLAAQGVLDTALLFATMISLAAMGIGFFALISAFERLWTPWRFRRRDA
jgi:NitT/TauT family transport system permease protein